MSTASLETTLDLWASSLREVKERMRPLFTQARVAASANAFLDGLLGPERRKTGWARAEAAGDEGPWRQQAILGRARWEADALRDIVRFIRTFGAADHGFVSAVSPFGHAASTRTRSRSWPARPYICRFMVLTRLICPS